MEPITSNSPLTQTTTAQPVAQLQAVVDLMPNMTVFGAKTVLLEWGADNRIRLYEMNFDTNQATGILFDAAPSDIKKVTGSVNMLTFHIGEKTYRTLFAAMRTGGMGVVGAGIALNELKASGVKLWTDKLKQNGVPVKLFGWGATFAVAIGVVVAVIAIVFVVQLANGDF
jgi:hypothetical protein